MPSLPDYWFAFECYCDKSVVLDVRIACTNESRGDLGRKLVVPCPMCGELMSWEASWEADASGYGSRSSDTMKILSDVVIRDWPVGTDDDGLRALEIAKAIVKAYDRELERRLGLEPEPEGA
jgi:hypothetical protein